VRHVCVARHAGRDRHETGLDDGTLEAAGGARTPVFPRIANLKRQEEGNRPLHGCKELSNSRAKCLRFEKASTLIGGCDPLLPQTCVSSPFSFAGCRCSTAISRGLGESGLELDRRSCSRRTHKNRGSTIGKNFPKQPRRRVARPALLETGLNLPVR
jgi:hypothetical protein